VGTVGPQKKGFLTSCLRTGSIGQRKTPQAKKAKFELMMHNLHYDYMMTMICNHLQKREFKI